MERDRKFRGELLQGIPPTNKSRNLRVEFKYGNVSPLWDGGIDLIHIERYVVNEGHRNRTNKRGVVNNI